MKLEAGKATYPLATPYGAFASGRILDAPKAPGRPPSNLVVAWSWVVANMPEGTRELRGFPVLIYFPDANTIGFWPVPHCDMEAIVEYFPPQVTI